MAMKDWNVFCRSAVGGSILPVLILLLLVGTSLSASARDLGQSELYAVVAGVAKYQDSRVRPLQLSDKDAKDFYTFLQDRKSLFAKAHMRLLVNEEATRNNLTKALREELKPARKDDIIIIYLSGHGASDPANPDEFYFICHDGRIDNLYGTAVRMNTQDLLKGIDSDRILMIADACYSAGFSEVLEKQRAKATDVFFSMFQTLQGRIAISSSRPDEVSFENPNKYGNSVFTHFLMKGLRGEACRQSSNGTITAKDLYQYVYDKAKEATKGRQSPQLYCAKGLDNDTPIFRAQTFKQPLTIKVQFAYKDDNEKTFPLTNESVLKTGQLVGCAFRPESDCYVYILWWDSFGNVARVFPNPKLTEGSGEVKAGRTYWLPSREGKHWYVLDKNVGDETIYFIASRERNPKIEALYDKLCSLSTAARSGIQGSELRNSLEKELDIMGAEDYTVPDKAPALMQPNLDGLFDSMENEIKVAGADAVFRLKFRHVGK